MYFSNQTTAFFSHFIWEINNLGKRNLSWKSYLFQKYPGQFSELKISLYILSAQKHKLTANYQAMKEDNWKYRRKYSYAQHTIYALMKMSWKTEPCAKDCM